MAAVLAAAAVVAAPATARAQYMDARDFGLTTGDLSGFAYACSQGTDPAELLEARRTSFEPGTEEAIVGTILFPTLAIPYHIMNDDTAPMPARVACGVVFYGQVIAITIVVAVVAAPIAAELGLAMGGSHIAMVSATVITEVGLGVGQRALITTATGTPRDQANAEIFSPTAMACDGVFPMMGSTFKQVVGHEADLFAKGAANQCGKDLAADIAADNNTFGLRLTERQRQLLDEERWGRLVRDGMAHHSYTVKPGGQIVNNPPKLNWNVEGSDFSNAMAHYVPGANATSQFHDVVEANFPTGGPGYVTMVPSATIAAGALIDRYEVYTVYATVQDINDDLGIVSCTPWRPDPATTPCTGGNRGMVDPPYAGDDEVDAGCSTGAGGELGLGLVILAIGLPRRRRAR
jgi:hypothetical protein